MITISDFPIADELFKISISSSYKILASALTRLRIFMNRIKEMKLFANLLHSLNVLMNIPLCIFVYFVMPLRTICAAYNFFIFKYVANVDDGKE